MAHRDAFVLIPIVVVLVACGSSSNNSSASAAGTVEPPLSGPKVYSLPDKCGPTGTLFACNPVTNMGCDGPAGQACDDDTKGGFGCYRPPNDVTEGGDCNIVDGPSCVGGFGCLDATATSPDGTCAKYCCASTDCKTGQRCAALDTAFGTLGLCQ